MIVGDAPITSSALVVERYYPQASLPVFLGALRFPVASPDHGGEDHPAEERHGQRRYSLTTLALSSWALNSRNTK